MGFRKGAYGKIWEIQPVKDNMTKLKISISKKDKSSGQYVRDFSGWVACIGTAAATKAMSLSAGENGDTIILGDVDVSNSYDAVKKVLYTDCKIFSFEVADNNGSSKPSSGGVAKDTAKYNGSVDSGEIDNDVDARLPF